MIGPESLVSIIMPVFNAAPLLAEAIESVLTQTYRHWELLVVDDGSTDGSRQLADTFAAQWAGRIRLLDHAPGSSPRGASVSRNVGLAHAQGD